MIIARPNWSCALALGLFVACAGAAKAVEQRGARDPFGVRGRVVRACDGDPSAGVVAAVFSGVEGRQLGASTSARDGSFLIPLPANQHGTLYYVQAGGAVRLFDGTMVEQGTEIIVLAPCPRKN